MRDDVVKLDKNFKEAVAMAIVQLDSEQGWEGPPSQAFLKSVQAALLTRVTPNLTMHEVATLGKLYQELEHTVSEVRQGNSSKE